VNWRTTSATQDSRHLEAAKGWLGLGNWHEASEELERITPEMRAHPDVLFLRWEIYTKAEKWERAAEVAQAISERDPVQVSVLTIDTHSVTCFCIQQVRDMRPTAHLPRAHSGVCDPLQTHAHLLSQSARHRWFPLIAFAPRTQVCFLSPLTTRLLQSSGFGLLLARSTFVTPRFRMRPSSVSRLVGDSSLPLRSSASRSPHTQETALSQRNESPHSGRSANPLCSLRALMLNPRRPRVIPTTGD